LWGTARLVHTRGVSCHPRTTLRATLIIVTALLLAGSSDVRTLAEAGSKTLEQARAEATAAIAKAEPLVTSWSEAVHALAKKVQEAGEPPANREALAKVAAELSDAAATPSAAVDAAVNAFRDLSRRLNQRRTIGNGDLARAARFKAVMARWHGARKTLQRTAKTLEPPPEPAPEKPPATD